MRTRIVYIIGMVVLFIINASAQPLDKTGIAGLVQKIDAAVGTDKLTVKELVVEETIPGIGPQTTTITFYQPHNFAEFPSKNEKESVAKICVRYSVTVRISYTIEYYFGKNNELLFSRKSATGEECYQERHYFAGDQLLCVEVEPRKEDCGGSENDRIPPRKMKEADFTRYELRMSTLVRKRAEGYKDMLFKYRDAENLETSE